ncbi:phospholipid/cholesterol/gamma-HCH transport system substrate-binding protein [Mesorhizobium sp. J18]|uniref:MlaD family protein n=1 Tax=Mesorhizobium sp. J18 TaxID=935263 RepID=UPI00119C1724|nr:MlaD family protein [Mesorhizobium sp. J18]TWG93814.1 phospholipid/cholesterol/gamma-HCH transport system substrate-binding protein [Mesorhizobium sp. J18]
METRANYVIVGLFTIVAILAAFAFIYWTAAIGERGEVATLRVRIPGSASGLGRGSAVLFNGVKVGDVQRVYLDLSNPSVAIADTTVDRLTPITPSTQADVGLAGLTGQANIELKGGNPDEPNLLDRAEAQGTVAEITASPSAVTNLLQTAQSILTRADTVVSQLEGFVGDARTPLTQTVENIRTFSDALAANSEGIDKFLEGVTALSETLSGVSGQLNRTLASAEELLNSVDPEKVRRVVDNIDQTVAHVEEFSRRVDTASQNLETIVSGVEQTVRSIGQFSEGANQTLGKVDSILDGIDSAQVKTALTNFEQASVTVNRAANDVSKVTETIGQRSEDIDQFITDAQQLASRLNQASTRVDGVLAKLDGLLGSDDAEGVIADARATLAAFREVAETLNARMGTITEGLARFSGQGLREVESLVRDSRRSISRIEQAISDLEQNPQRIITGGEGEVRRYDGRVRR